MEISIRELIPVSVFLGLFILTLFLGSSYLFICIAGLLIVWCLWQRDKLNWDLISRNVVLLSLWLLFLLGLAISSVFTHHLPFTINSLFFYFSSFIVFWAFLLNKEKSLIWLWGWVLVAIVIAILSVVFIFFPDLGKNIPGANFTFSTHGHNHSAALIILLLPLSWYVSSQLQNKRWWLIPVFLTLALLATFGRVAILLGLLETLLVFRYLHRMPPRWIKLGILGLLATVICFKLFFSFGLFDMANEDFCPVPNWENQLCKPVSQEQRLAYWMQAAKGFRNSPLVGYGPGTYLLINRLYSQSPQSLTSFAHNTWLQLASEGGLIVVIPFLLLSIFFAKGVIKNANYRDEKFFIALGVGVSIINAFFDFDWQLYGMWIAFLIMVSYVISDSKISVRHSLSLSSVILRSVWYLISVISVVVMTLFIVTEYKTRTSSTSEAFNFFPYFLPHQPVFGHGYNQLSLAQQQKLKDINKFNPVFNEELLINQMEEHERFEIKKQIIQTNQWYLTQDSNLTYALNYSRLSDAEAEINQLRQLLAEYPLAIHEFRYEYKVKTALAAAQVADYQVVNNNHEKASESYRLAYTLEPWIFDKYRPTFLTDGIRDKNNATFFLKEISYVTPENFGRNREFYSQLHMKLAETAIEELDYNQALTHAKAALMIAPWKANEIWTNHGQMLLVRARDYLAQGRLDQAIEWTEASTTLWRELKPFKHEVEYELQHDLAKWLVFLGERTVGKQKYAVGALYQQALEIRPWVLTEEGVWLEFHHLEKVDEEEIISYAKAMIGKKGEDIGWRTDQHLLLYKRAQEIAIERQNNSLIEEFEAQVRLLHSN